MTDSISQKPVMGFDVSPSDLPDNTDPRCPTVLILDVSGSMTGAAIRELQSGVAQYVDELSADSLAKRRVEVAIITFGGKVEVLNTFSTAEGFTTPTLTAAGDTPMGQAIVTSLDLLKERKIELSKQGIPQYRAWVFLITDGGPTDEHLNVWKEAIERLREGEGKKSFMFFSVGVQGANFEKLKLLSNERPPLKLDGLRFRDLFQWLSASQKMVSSSSPGEKVSLPPVDWGTITA